MYRMLIVDDEKNERDCILYLLKNSGLPLEIREASCTGSIKGLACSYFIYRRPNAKNGRA